MGVSPYLLKSWLRRFRCGRSAVLLRLQALTVERFAARHFLTAAITLARNSGSAAYRSLSKAMLDAPCFALCRLHAPDLHELVMEGELASQTMLFEKGFERRGVLADVPQAGDELAAAGAEQPDRAVGLVIDADDAAEPLLAAAAGAIL